MWTVALYDAEQKFYYLKRFQLEPSAKLQSFLGENPESKLMLISGKTYPRIEVVFGRGDAFREALVVDAEEFIGVKSFKAKGKRLTTFEVESINELEPIRFKPEKETEEKNEADETDEINADETSDEPETENENDESSETNSDEPIDQQRLIDDITGQMTLF